MSIEPGLLADIIDHPDDDSLRLIYADWLEDHGRPERAEYIRLDLAKERGAALAPGDRELRRKLYQEHHKTWSAAIDRLVRRRVYRRGLIESVYLTGEQYVRGAAELSRLAPVREVSFCDQVDLKRVAAAVAHARTSSLNLTGCAVTSEGLSGLADAAPLTKLDSIELSGPLDLRSLGALLNSPVLSGLPRLSLSRIWGDHHIGPFLGGPLGGLRELQLKGVWLGDAGVHALANSFHSAQLRSLGLRSAFLRDPGAAALARSAHLAGLERLDVRFNHLSAQARGLLAERFGDRVVLD